MSIFTLIAGIGPDDWDEYETGAIDQRDRCEHEARTIAFGAIRRAAELARQADHNARSARFGGYELDAHASEAIAKCLRFTIRAAIGSDKS